MRSTLAGRLVALMGAGVLVLAATGGVATAQSASDRGDQPPGNNGTIKIHDPDTDEQFRGNEPHVGCDFVVDFYGFDGWGNDSEMTFELWSPTEATTATPYTRHVDLAVANRESGAQWDHRETFTAAQVLNGQTATPHPEQGFHVQLTVDTTDAAPNGAQVKHKTFWMGPCGPAVAAASTTTTTTTTVAVASVSASSTTATPAGPSVLGQSISAAATAAAAPASAPTTAPAVPQVLGLHLARTGGPLALLAALGIVLTLAGVALTRTADG